MTEGLDSRHRTAEAASGWRRAVPPEQTVARLLPLLPLFGITRVANVTGLDRIGIPVIMVNRPNARMLAVSQGKGITLAAARASGLMESIESWHAERIDRPLKYGSYEELCYTHDIPDPFSLPRLASSSYTPFTPLLWIEGQSLQDGRGRWVPFELVHTAFVDPLPPGSGCFLGGTNGLASGNTRDEAILHGLCELIERDALTLWHLQEARLEQETRLDLETVADPVCRTLLQRFARAGIDVGVWDITSDLAIPAFLCRIIDHDRSTAASVRPTTGAGCHPIREIALCRALTEAAQSRLTQISGARDDMTRADYARMLDPEEQEKWRRTIQLGVTTRHFSAIPSRITAGTAEDLVLLQTRLAGVGLTDVIVVDLTRAELGIPVVKVIVPGLEAIDSDPSCLLGQRGQAKRGRR